MGKMYQMRRQSTFRHVKLQQLYEHASSTDDWETGDLGMYTQEMLDARANLRFDHNVCHALEDWWRAIESELSPESRHNGSFSRENYLTVFMKTYRALYPVTDEAEVMACVLGDWGVDCKGKEFMKREEVLDALFDLTDHWNDEILSEDYCSFLRDLQVRARAHSSLHTRRTPHAPPHAPFSRAPTARVPLAVGMRHEEERRRPSGRRSPTGRVYHARGVRAVPGADGRASLPQRPRLRIPPR